MQGIFDSPIPDFAPFDNPASALADGVTLALALAVGLVTVTVIFKVAADIPDVVVFMLSKEELGPAVVGNGVLEE